MSDQNKYTVILTAAEKARKFSQAKYSQFFVGAALETETGDIITGCNVESSSYGLTICAERVALTKALSDGKTKFIRIAVIGPNDEFCPPCGACRQLLIDYAPNIEIITTDGKHIQVKNIRELLPDAFEENRLKNK